MARFATPEPTFYDLANQRLIESWADPYLKERDRRRTLAEEIAREQRARDFAAEQARLQREFQGTESRLGRELTVSEGQAGRELTKSEGQASRLHQAIQGRLNRELTVSERIALQKFQGDQAQLVRDFQETQNRLGREHLTTENRLGREFQGTESKAQRAWQAGQNAQGRSFLIDQAKQAADRQQERDAELFRQNVLLSNRRVKQLPGETIEEALARADASAAERAESSFAALNDGADHAQQQAEQAAAEYTADFNRQVNAKAMELALAKLGVLQYDPEDPAHIKELGRQKTAALELVIPSAELAARRDMWKAKATTLRNLSDEVMKEGFRTGADFWKFNLSGQQQYGPPAPAGSGGTTGASFSDQRSPLPGGGTTPGGTQSGSDWTTGSAVMPRAAVTAQVTAPVKAPFSDLASMEDWAGRTFSNNPPPTGTNPYQLVKDQFLRELAGEIGFPPTYYGSSSVARDPVVNMWGVQGPFMDYLQQHPEVAEQLQNYSGLQNAYDRTFKYFQEQPWYPR